MISNDEDDDRATLTEFESEISVEPELIVRPIGFGAFLKGSEDMPTEFNRRVRIARCSFGHSFEVPLNQISAICTCGRAMYITDCDIGPDEPEDEQPEKRIAECETCGHWFEIPLESIAVAPCGRCGSMMAVKSSHEVTLPFKPKPEAPEGVKPEIPPVSYVPQDSGIAGSLIAVLLLFSFIILANVIGNIIVKNWMKG